MIYYVVQEIYGGGYYRSLFEPWADDPADARKMTEGQARRIAAGRPGWRVVPFVDVGTRRARAAGVPCYLAEGDDGDPRRITEGDL